MVFNSLPGFGDQALVVIILVLCAGITSHIMFGYGTRRARETFVGLILLLAVGVQIFHLIPAATTVPANRFYTWRERYHRQDCLESNKGGKRPKGSKKVFDINPCYCHAGATCVYLGENTTAIHHTVGTCPIDKLFKCVDSYGTKIHPYVSSKRDCSGGREAICSKDQPCTPCNMDALKLWDDAPRCRTCSSDYQGQCSFVEGVGPYCLVSPHSKAVEPCKLCCTEPGFVLVSNGTHTKCL